MEAKSNDTKRRYSRRPITAHSALHSMLKQYNLVDGFAKYQFVLRWDEIVGSAIAKHARPDCLRGSTLYVQVESSVWATELSFQKQLILERLAEYREYGKPITEIKFTVAGIKSPSLKF